MADIVSVDPASIGWQGQWAYYDPSDGSLVKYDWNNNPMVLGTVYKDPSGNEVPESEAKEFSGSATPPGTVHGTVKPLSAMMGDLGFDATDIYPQSMTREKIYMFEDPVGSGNWVDAPEDTRFIKTLSEIQNAIGMNPTTGALPYPSLPTEGFRHCGSHALLDGMGRIPLRLLCPALRRTLRPLWFWCHPDHDAVCGWTHQPPGIPDKRHTPGRLQSCRT